MNIFWSIPAKFSALEDKRRESISYVKLPKNSFKTPTKSPLSLLYEKDDGFSLASLSSYGSLQLCISTRLILF